MTEMDLGALWVTLRLASMTVVVLLVVGTPLAWWLAHYHYRFRPIVEAVVALPIVLPPTVLGFYILVALRPYGPLGRLTNLTFAFTFTGLVIASVFFSMPFVIQPLQGAFQATGKSPLEAAWSLRASKLDAFSDGDVPDCSAGIYQRYSARLCAHDGRVRSGAHGRGVNSGTDESPVHDHL